MPEIPFYKNTKDDTHCFQACLMMALKFYFPKKNFSFSYLDRISAHKKGMWTWNSTALIFLADTKFKVIDIEYFDYRKFVQGGEKYLKKLWSEEVYETQKDFSDFKQERRLAKKFLDYVKKKKIIYMKRGAKLADIEGIFKKDFLIMIPVNPFIFLRKPGYASHLVLITDMDKKTVTFHDPGLPPMKNKKVSRKVFLSAMKYPDKESASLIAIKWDN